ncbi:MAG TPA: PD-(D/E)XK nuclease family transposase, partial [Allocoleopsis sp.]
MELPKFKKAIEELNTLVEKWLFFLKNAEKFTEKPPILEENDMLNKALEISNLVTVSKDELEQIQ